MGDGAHHPHPRRNARRRALCALCTTPSQASSLNITHMTHITHNTLRIQLQGRRRPVAPPLCLVSCTVRPFGVFRGSSPRVCLRVLPRMLARIITCPRPAY